MDDRQWHGPPVKRKSKVAGAPAGRSTKPSQSVLIVDDNRDVAMALATLLRGRGHTVEVAHDALAALGVVRRFRPSVALVDLGLPGIDGCELAGRLRADGDLAGLRLVAVTGAVRATDLERARLAGFSDHFAKPFDVDRLIAAVERA